MNVGRYNRSVPLLCPTCGGTQFESDSSSAEDVAPVKCASCQREFTRDELIEANSENVAEHVEEMGKEIVKDLAKELRRAFSKR